MNPDRENAITRAIAEYRRQANDLRNSEPECAVACMEEAARRDRIADDLMEVEVALLQAADMAEHVSRAAKGELAKSADRFLGMPYAQRLKGLLHLLRALPTPIA